MPAPALQLRNVPARPLRSPPAIWAAFVRQGAWKSWVIAAQFFVIAVLLVVLGLALRRPPDVVVVQGDGKSQYVAATELARFLAEQKQQPSDLTVTRFARDFLKLATAINSSTVDEAWPEALAYCGPSLRARLADEATKQKLVDGFKAARIRTELQIDDLLLVDRTANLLHVRATVTRSKFSLVEPSQAPQQDRFVHDLVMQVVPRTPTHPDGLEISDWRAAPVSK